MYKGYFFDLDGVAYLGNQVIETCRDFVNQLISDNIQVSFLTNNSSRTSQTVANHLIELGYHISLNHVITSSQVTANYLSEFKNKKVFLIGMDGIRQELIKIGCEFVTENADFVVVGLDRLLTFEKLAIACKEIRSGATFISTNGDLKLSTADAIIPGNGSITAAIELTTDVKPIVMGKPKTAMFEYALKKLGLSKDEVVMVGDNYYTDIQGALNFGMDSLFVETGIMSFEDIAKFDKQPTHLVKDLSYFKIK